jgi:hypothetical protein
MTPDTQSIAFNAAYPASDLALAFLFESAAHSGYADRETLSAAIKRVDLDEDEFDDEDKEDDFDEDDDEENDDDDDEEEDDEDEYEDDEDEDLEDEDDDEDKDDEDEDELNLI